MSGLLATVNPRRIKAAHRRRRKVASGQSVQRYYDPQIGRFLSVDPVTANGSTGANFNRYWYGNNNPYRFTDPDGRFACEILGICPIPDSMKDPRIVAADKQRGEDGRRLLTAVGASAGAGAGAALIVETGIVGVAASTTKQVVTSKPFREIVCAAFSLGRCDGEAIHKTSREKPGEVRQEMQRVEDAKRVSEAATRVERGSVSGAGKADPKGDSLDTKGFQGVFRVDGKIDSMRLDRELSKK